jgi:hypothetical protein
MVAGESGEDGNALEELHSNLESLYDPRHLDLSDSFIATTSNYRPDDSRASSSGIAYLGQVSGGSDPGQIVVPMEDAKIKECASTITIHNLRSGKEVTRIEATPGLGGFNCISLAPDGDGSPQPPSHPLPLRAFQNHVGLSSHLIPSHTQKRRREPTLPTQHQKKHPLWRASTGPQKGHDTHECEQGLSSVREEPMM